MKENPISICMCIFKELNPHLYLDMNIFTYARYPFFVETEDYPRM